MASPLLDKLAADIFNAPFKAHYTEKDMGTGVKGSEQVETAASIMRREAQSLRRRAAEFEKLGIEARVKMGDELREMDRLRAEARKLEDAAHLIEPVVPVNEARDTSGVMRFSPDEMGESVSIGRNGEVTRHPAPESVVTSDYVERKVPRYGAEGFIKSYAKAERKAPRYEDPGDPGPRRGEFAAWKKPLFENPDHIHRCKTGRPVHHVALIGYGEAEVAIQAALITPEEIEDGFLNPLHTVLGESPQSAIWTRLRKVAGLE